ncbi:MAG: response regulator [Cellvibrionaceae bacterium]|nr:response regulator [Cellvibrionaceae bacterium]
MSGKNYRLLFVDDEQRVLRSLKSIFRRKYEVYTASSGQEALAILKREAINVIICDQRMPGMTGDEVLARARADHPRVMRILLTGYIDKQAILNTINEGEIYRYISKPWAVDGICTVVAEAAEASRYVRSIQVVADTAPGDDAVVEDDSAGGPIASAPRTGNTVKARRTVRKALPSTELATVSKLQSRSHQQALKVTAGKAAIPVLLLDSDQSVRNAIRAMGRRFGLCIYSASSYFQAAKTLTLKSDIGIVIAGVAVDPRETIEALHLFKQHRPNLTVIALADVTDAHVAIELINKDQIFRYLEKPIADQAFVKAMVAAIKRHQMLSDIDELNRRYQVQKISEFTSSGISRLRSILSKSA